MSEPGTIYGRMCAIQAEFPAVTKSRGGSGINYKYRGIDDGLAALNPLLAKHGVFLRMGNLTAEFSVASTTSTGKTNYRCVLQGTLDFVATDGSCVTVSIAGEGIDTADKALMKAQANALKYAIWYTFCVPTDEKKDSEAFEAEPTEDDDEESYDPRPKRT